MTDEQMVQDFVALGDRVAFEALLRKYGPLVLRVCRDVLGDRELAEDAFQATFLVLIRQAGSIRDHRSTARWLYEVACRISRRERQRNAKIRLRERQVPVTDETSPPDFDLVDSEWKQILHQEISRLPSKLREPIILCYFEGLAVEEAANRLRCPVGTLKSRLVKARELLRSRLSRRGLAASAMLLLLFTMTEAVSASVPEPLLQDTLHAGLAAKRGVKVAGHVADIASRECASHRSASLTTAWVILIASLMLLNAYGSASGSYLLSKTRAAISVDSLAAAVVPPPPGSSCSGSTPPRASERDDHHPRR